MRANVTNRLWVFLVATLLVRALVPVGWMPDTGRTDVLVAKVCNADYVLRIPLKRDNKPAEDSSHQSSNCLFAGFGGDAPLPEAELVTALAPPVHQARVAALAELLLERVAYLTPPGRGPPVTA